METDKLKSVSVDEASSINMDFQENVVLTSATDHVIPSFTDQVFLLNFIMSNYIGPDVYSDSPRCSASQRLVKGLPPYTSHHLGCSVLSLSQLMNLYYYVLRNADASLLLEPDILFAYLKDKLTLPGSASSDDYVKFTSFFPMHVHERKKYSENLEIVKGIVLIDHPSTSYMKKEDLERFRCLSGLNDLKIDRDKSLAYQRVITQAIKEDATLAGNDNGSAREIENKEIVCERSIESSAEFQQTRKRKKRKRLREGLTRKRTPKTDGPVMMPLLSVPDMDDCVSDASITLKGTAREGIVGPTIGTVDIGISEMAYFFQVALPGVKRDDGQFSCEIESGGKVILQGTTSGGQIIKKESRVFEMKFQRLCQSGQFMLSFTLPGPVDPRLFQPNFRSDGIFEAVIIKDKDQQIS